MERRGFVRGSLLALAGTAVLSTSPSSAQHAGTLRADWTPTGPRAGREPVDASALSDEERVHAPRLTLPVHVHAGRPFDLVVQIGSPPHECTETHRIDWVEISVGERRVAVVDLSVDVPFPIVRLPIVLRESSSLLVRARCTEHGIWLTRRAIEVAM